MAASRLNLDAPRYDQSTYAGRARHFFNVCDPRTVFATKTQLEAAKQLVSAYKAGKEPKGTSAEQVWKAKKLYDSAYHPQTGELLFVLGRMSFQVPGNMLITGAMITWYKNPSE